MIHSWAEGYTLVSPSSFTTQLRTHHHRLLFCLHLLPLLLLLGRLLRVTARSAVLLVDPLGLDSILHRLTPAAVLGCEMARVDAEVEAHHGVALSASFADFGVAAHCGSRVIGIWLGFVSSLACMDSRCERT